MEIKIFENHHYLYALGWVEKHEFQFPDSEGADKLCHKKFN